jgi:subtilisin family serine protease
MTRIASLAVLAVAVLLAAGGPRIPLATGGQTEVVVLLESPGLARAPDGQAAVEREQAAFRRALATRLPAAEIGWRYRLVANGFSVSLPSSDVDRLGTLPGVRDVLPAGSYAPQLNASPQQIGAPALWGQALDTAGQGMKIGIIDSGIDPAHPFFAAAGYTMPPGFPKGQERFTSAKIIVARVFAPRNTVAPSARVAYSDDDSTMALTSPASRPAIRTPAQAAAPASPGWRHGHTWATTRFSSRRTRASVPTRTRRRSWQRSRRQWLTVWT